MKGLELSEKYFFEIGLHMLQKIFAQYIDRIAAGLVGEGSECYGVDDEISRDHDWGASFCLWLTPEDYTKIGCELQVAYTDLPKEFLGYEQRKEQSMAGARSGVICTPAFFQRLIGLDHVPNTLEEWITANEYGLSAATNGRVFYDPLGQFSNFRDSLLAYYPDDIRLKRIAANCMKMGQAGQYNYTRCYRHGEKLTSQITLALFVESTISMVFLLNKQYRPFYKWMHRLVKSLPILGDTIYYLLNKFTENYWMPEKERVMNNYHLIEEISALVIQELYCQGLSTSRSDFLFDHGPVIQKQIKSQWLRSQNVMND